jgi:catechol 2,3-dioxygenase-like lactoylglutathione lyase family enzyme
MHPKARLVGINHVALEVRDVEDSLRFLGSLLELRRIDREPGMAFIDMGDQFLALVETDEDQADKLRHFGLVVDSRDTMRAALERNRVEVNGEPRLNFRDPSGNQFQVVQYFDIQFTKAASVMCGMGLGRLEKSDRAVAELRAKGLDSCRR